MTTAPREVTDFEAIIEGLRRAGFRLQAISGITGIPRGTLIRYLIDGSTPSHDKGEVLVAFYCQVLGATREQVPTRRWRASAAHVAR